MKIVFVSLMFAASVFAQDKPAPAEPPKPAAKHVPMSADQQKTLQLFNERSFRLQQEERSVQAEQKLLQTEAQKYFDDACKAAGGSVCQPNTQAPDPKDWTIVVLTPAK